MGIWKRLPKKTIVFILILIGIYGGGGYYGLPILARDHLPRMVSQWFDLTVTIKDASFNPLLVSTQLEGVEISEKDKETPFLSADNLIVQLSPESIVRFAPVISKIRLDRPKVDIIRFEDGSLSLVNQFKAKPSEQAQNSEKPAKADTASSLPEMILKKVSISNGEVRFQDRPHKVDHDFKNITFSLPYLSTQKKALKDKVGMDLAFTMNGAGIDLHLQGTFFEKDIQKDLENDLEIAPNLLAWVKTGDIQLMDYAAYFSIPDTLDIQSLLAATDIEILYIGKENTPSLSLQGSLSLKDFALANGQKEPVLGFSELNIALAPSHVLKKELKIEKAMLTDPSVILERDAQGRFNLLSLLPDSESEPQKPDTSENDGQDDPESNAAVDLVVDWFDVENGTLMFTDLSGEVPFDSQLKIVTAKFSSLAFPRPVDTDFSVTVQTDAQEAMTSSGTFNLETASVKGEFNISDLLPSKYAPLLGHSFKYEVARGKIDGQGTFDLSFNDGKPAGGAEWSNVLIAGLSVRDPKSKQTYLDLPSLSIRDGKIDFGQNQIDTGIIKSSGLTLNLIRQPGDPDNKPIPMNRQKNATNSESTKHWEYRVPGIDVANASIDFKDHTCNEPVHLKWTDLDINAANISTVDDKAGTLTIQSQWNETGKIQIKGAITAAKKTADLKVKLDKIDIRSLEPYFTDAVKVKVNDGFYHADGQLTMTMNETGRTKTRFQGQTSVTGFASQDKASGHDFLNAKSLFISGLDVAFTPVKIAATDISLTDFYSRIIVDENGRLNLNSIFKNENSTSSALVQKAETPYHSPDIHISSVTLQGGQIRFSDYLTKPNFNASMKEVSGSVTGLSSDQKQNADLFLKGIHGQASPLEIKGRINPFAEKKFADIDVSFKDIELTHFSPYAAKYLGYEIEKGKLILDLEYHIEGNSLSSENRVKFDNFALGSKVESKDATALPVRLAVSLLKNNEGQINLDLPVSGDLDDPQFSFARTIFKMVGNLIIKVAASPFSMIGAMFNGGEDLEYLDFEPGVVGIDEIANEKITQIAGVLAAKPSVKLEIQGVVDPTSEFGILQQKRFDELIKTEKINQMQTGKKESSTIDSVTITPEELPVYIYLAYTKARFPKPRNKDGSEKQINTEEKKKLLMTHMSLKKEDLRELSLKRAENIKAAIMAHPNIQKERLYIKEPTEVEKGQSGSQVRFSLK